MRSCPFCQPSAPLPRDAADDISQIHVQLAAARSHGQRILPDLIGLNECRYYEMTGQELPEIPDSVLSLVSKVVEHAYAVYLAYRSRNDERKTFALCASSVLLCPRAPVLVFRCLYTYRSTSGEISPLASYYQASAQPR